VISKSEDIDMEISSRIGKGATVFHRMHCVWLSKSFSTKIKLRPYTSHL